MVMPGIGIQNVWNRTFPLSPDMPFENGLPKTGFNRRVYAPIRGGTWEKLSVDDPVLPVGASGEWDDTEVEIPQVILDTDGVYKMLYSGRDSVGANRYIGLATSTDLVTWSKDASNPVIDDNISPLVGPMRPTGFLRHPDGTYYAFVADDANGDASLHVLTSSDLTSWTHEAEIDTAGVTPLVGNAIRIGLVYYMIVKCDLSNGDETLCLFYSADPTNAASWQFHNGNPVYRVASGVEMGSPNMMVLDDTLLIHWEEYTEPLSEGENICYQATLPLSLLHFWGVPTNNINLAQRTVSHTFTDTAYTAQDELVSNFVTMRTQSDTQDNIITRAPAPGGEENSSANAKVQVRIQALLSNDTGTETTSLRIAFAGSTPDNIPESEVTSSAGASDEYRDSGWVDYPVTGEPTRRIQVEGKVSGGTATVKYLSVDVAWIPQMWHNPDNPTVLSAGGSGAWDEGRVVEGHLHYFGGKYLYAFYEARASGGDPPSQIGLVRTEVR